MDEVYLVEHDGNVFIYWKHGIGLIPLHHEKSIREEFEYRIQLKKFLRAV